MQNVIPEYAKYARQVVSNSILLRRVLVIQYWKNKGTHKGINRLRAILRRASRNNTLPCVVLKCDIRKFFQSVDHDILLTLLGQRVADEKAIWLLKEIINSFEQGLPIGNLTSQLFANFYLNGLDQFIKQQLKARFYLRYTDDFILVGSSIEPLQKWLKEIQTFLKENLKLELHPNKVILSKYHQGIDFLGYVQFPHYRLLRIKTKKRMLKKIGQGMSDESLQSYLGVLSHANAYELSERVKNEHWLNEVGMG